MTTTFSTWQSLYAEMLNIAAEFYSGRMSVAEYTVTTGSGSRHFRYRTEKEFREGLEYVKTQAQIEASGLSPLSFVATPRRTYAVNGGR